ncbi:MAG: copper-binding protein [Thaumarchaeota archaeon]|nr:copper-binding protein [Nitrososphaerota archaeon]
MPISIVVKDPSGVIVLIGQVAPNRNNSYSTTVTAGGDLWTAAGTYTIYVTYGSKDNTASTTFAYTGTKIIFPITIEGSVYNATYEITNGKVLGIIPTTSTRSLTVRIQPSGSGLLTINLPRSLIDAKTEGQDSNYAVQEDGVSVPFNQTSSDTNSRTLAIPFNSTNSQITIIGTQMVPEFETIAVLVLGISMTVPIVYLRIKTPLKS